MALSTVGGFHHGTPIIEPDIASNQKETVASLHILLRDTPAKLPKPNRSMKTPERRKHKTDNSTTTHSTPPIAHLRATRTLRTPSPSPSRCTIITREVTPQPRRPSQPGATALLFSNPSAASTPRVSTSSSHAITSQIISDFSVPLPFLVQKRASTIVHMIHNNTQLRKGKIRNVCSHRGSHGYYGT